MPAYQEWIAAARNGDLDAFNRLVLAFQDMAYAQAYRILGDAQAAEDITQEAMLAAYQKIKQYRGGSWRAWLLRIVTNGCYDYLRYHKRRPATALEPLSDQMENAGESAAWMRDSAETPEESVLRSELQKAIQHCLEDLPVDFRTVVVLVDIQGFDYREAAEVISRPVGTVRSRLARARSKMQACLQGFAELLPAAFRLESI